MSFGRKWKNWGFGRTQGKAPFGMRVYDRGDLVRVTVDKRGVREFRKLWPGSVIPATGVSFVLEKRTGDLVELHPYRMDTPDVLALQHDAWNHAIDRLGLDPSLKSRARWWLLRPRTGSRGGR